MKTKLLKKSLLKVFTVTIIASIVILINMGIATYATDIPENTEDNWISTKASNEDYTFLIGAKKQDGKYKKGDYLNYCVSIIPNSEEKMSEEMSKDMMVSFQLPEGVEYMQTKKYTYGLLDTETEDKVAYNRKTRTLKWKIATLHKSDEIIIETMIGENVFSNELDSSAVLTYLDKKIESDNLKIELASSNISVTSEAQNIKAVNQIGDEIELDINIRNDGEAPKVVKVELELPDEITMNKYILADNIEVESEASNFADDNIIVEENSNYTLKFFTKINNSDTTLLNNNKT